MGAIHFDEAHHLDALLAAPRPLELQPRVSHLSISTDLSSSPVFSARMSRGTGAPLPFDGIETPPARCETKHASGIVSAMDVVEREVARLNQEGKRKELATLVVENYGPEVLAFLVVFLNDRVDAHDAFGLACEDLWKGLPGFEGRSSIKTWFYVLARHAALRLRRSQRHRRAAPVSEISEVAAAVQSRTDPYLRSEMKAGVAAIRAELEESDRALLVLRVDQEMGWNEIASVMSEPEASKEEIARTAARLRKRFQSVKKAI